MSDYDISVIIPVYNGEEYIQQCIQSVLDQTKDNIEIVIVNDGSTDRTPEIIQAFAEKCEHIQIINQENGGLEAARITGFEAAKGKYIGWLDADDYIDPRMYTVLYQAAEENGAELVYCNYHFFPTAVSAKVKWYRPYNGKRDWRYLDKNTQFWNKLFSRELLERTNLVELLDKYGEYAPILPMMEANEVVSIDEELHYYRVGHDSMSGGSVNGKVDHYRLGADVSSHLKEMIAGKAYAPELDSYFDYRYIYTLIMLTIVAAKNKDRKTYEEARKQLRAIKYLRNEYLDIIIPEHYGKLKSFVITRIIPFHFIPARVITQAAL